MQLCIIADILYITPVSSNKIIMSVTACFQETLHRQSPVTRYWQQLLSSQFPAVQRGMPSHSRTLGVFVFNCGPELYGDLPCILCTCRQAGFPGPSGGSPVFMLRWFAAWQIALGQRRVTEENVLH